jgi:hypothetical protein
MCATYAGAYSDDMQHSSADVRCACRPVHEQALHARRKEAAGSGRLLAAFCAPSVRPGHQHLLQHSTSDGLRQARPALAAACLTDNW